METLSLHHTKPYVSHSPLVPFNRSTTTNPHQISFPLAGFGAKLLPHETKRNHGQSTALLLKCVALSSGALAVAEIVSAEEEEEWRRVGKLGEKCRERKGVVELLECLEREAIMGEDEGKDPIDYNRRAQIFDKSSRVFQALKQLNSSSLASSDNQ